MRGKVVDSVIKAGKNRITPAQAGKRAWLRQQPLGYRDHPRACGEKNSPVSMFSTPTGSPPRMRGKAAQMAAAQAAWRITPAHAGKRSSRPKGWALMGDHPRACGEKSTATVSFVILLGSPPRMRGKVDLRTESGQKQGITPAHAGKSLLLANQTTSFQDHPRACGEKTLCAVPLSCS